MVKNPPANAANTGDLGSIHGWRPSPGGGMDKPVPPVQYCCLKNPKDRTEEPGKLQFMGSQRVGCD